MNTIKKIFYVGMLLALLEFSVMGYSLSLPGPTGFLNVPSPETTPAKKFLGGISYQSYNFGGNTNFNIVSYKATFGISDNFEVGIEKTTDSGSLVRDPGMTISGKASWKISDDVKMATGVIIDTTSGNASSIYGVLGADIAFFGMGFNFGADSGTPYNLARLGGYDLVDLEPEKIFFLAGAKMDFGDSGSLTISYNGDAVGIGFIGELAEEDGLTSAVEIGWISEGDYEDLFQNGSYYNSKYSKDELFFGISGEF